MSSGSEIRPFDDGAGLAHGTPGHLPRGPLQPVSHGGEPAEAVAQLFGGGSRLEVRDRSWKGPRRRRGARRRGRKSRACFGRCRDGRTVRRAPSGDCRPAENRLEPRRRTCLTNRGDRLVCGEPWSHFVRDWDRGASFYYFMPQLDSRPPKDTRSRNTAGGDPNSFNWRGVILLALAVILAAGAILIKGPYSSPEKIDVQQFESIPEGQPDPGEQGSPAGTSRRGGQENQGFEWLLCQARPAGRRGAGALPHQRGCGVEQGRARVDQKRGTRRPNCGGGVEPAGLGVD